MQTQTRQQKWKIPNKGKRIGNAFDHSTVPPRTTLAVVSQVVWRLLRPHWWKEENPVIRQRQPPNGRRQPWVTTSNGVNELHHAQLRDRTCEKDKRHIARWMIYGLTASFLPFHASASSAQFPPLPNKHIYIVHVSLAPIQFNKNRPCMPPVSHSPDFRPSGIRTPSQSKNQNSFIDHVPKKHQPLKKVKKRNRTSLMEVCRASEKQLLPRKWCDKKKEIYPEPTTFKNNKIYND